MMSFPSRRLSACVLALVFFLPGSRPAAAALGSPPPISWTLQDIRQVGGQTPTVWGAPQAVADGALHFNGASDGLLMPVNPISGWEKFTVAVLFLPEVGGPDAPRFLHIEDENAHRVTIEARLVGDKSWYMDTFLLAGAGSRVLIDPKKLHPLNQWAWAELVYDGQTMTSYVDGVRELTGPVAFPPMAAGKVSVGVRQNKVYWFKGQIREVRFYSSALAPADLPRAP